MLYDVYSLYIIILQEIFIFILISLNNFGKFCDFLTLKWARAQKFQNYERERERTLFLGLRARTRTQPILKSAPKLCNQVRTWLPTLDWNISKGNQAPTQKIERPYRKIPKSKFFWPRSRSGAPSSLESSMKRFLGRFELNQNKSKQMKNNDVFHCFTSKAYFAAILIRMFYFYQLKVPKQLTWKFSIFSKTWYFHVNCLGTLSW